VTLRAAWDDEAGDWIRFAGEADVFAWRFNLPAFLELVPPPGRLTVDVGCGEGRVARVLMEAGHTVKGIDGSPALVEAARAGDPPVDAEVADAAALPLPDGSADLVVSFMTLQSVDELDGAIAEAARALQPGGRLVAAIVHPMNTAAGAGSYFEPQHLPYEHERDGVRIVLHDMHRPLSAYFEALAAAGFVTEVVREPIPGRPLLDVQPAAERWTRAPCFLHFRARKE
jgi:ubiquinone/menaquinone biosynthesis C-methylase UbiE